ncbi:hypothetical protein DE146DRAFT_647031 [Phaeosphaeria sp. MPI-PUGE-AT-0046c]|nr:hypothetical protein DE146DRAFT_647031 [Phaeosphaeria sp. MPI-PUGE-AT-0046c]
MEGANEPLVCRFCGRKLARSDALKRHWKSCRVRRDHALDVPRTRAKIRGRKPRACDLCSQLKRACTATQPCTLCVSREEHCTYSKLQGRSSPRRHDSIRQAASLCGSVPIPEADDFDPTLTTINDSRTSLSILETAGADLMPTNDVLFGLQNFAVSLPGQRATWTLLEEQTLFASVYRRPTQLDLSLLNQFPFLDRFTRSTGFATSFDCGNKENRLLVIARSDAIVPLHRFQLDKPPDLIPEPGWAEITRDALTSRQNSNSSACFDGLLPTTHEIVSRIREVALTNDSHCSTSMTWSLSLEALCYEFFHPTALQRQLTLFWSCWYPNWPAIHRPTFDATKASPALVATMALIGACLSPDEREHATAQIWLDVVEKVVFSDELFLDHDLSKAWNNCGDVEARKSHIDILQAAYCVCLYQTWEGSKRSKRRALRQRFNDLVYFARDIGLAQASLRAVDTSHPAAFDWDEFVLRESFSRLCSYICNIDASYTLFFRNPPRMAFSELVMELSSPESCFQAQTKEECFIELKSWRGRSGLRSNNLTVIEAVEALSDLTIMNTGMHQRTFAHLSVLNMFTLVHALYLQLHHFQISGLRYSSATVESPLALALTQWQTLWSSPSRDAELVDMTRRQEAASTGWQSIGFIRHAPEYWLLAHLSLQKSQYGLQSSTTPSAITSCEDIDMGGAKVLIAEFKNTAVGLSWQDEQERLASPTSR